MRSIRAVIAVAVVAWVALATGIGAALATGDGERSGTLATAVIHSTVTGDRVGVAVFKERDGKVIVSARVWGLDAGFHGSHVHEVGQCVPPPSAGGHLRRNPNELHGDHAGDVPSLLVNKDGTGQLQFATDRFKIRDLFDTDGSAFIVHGGRDNYANIPNRYTSGGVPGPDEETLATGDSGARVACGVIEQIGRDGDDDDD
jgi:superoxide dismutase, Cu-Zn family